MMSPLAMNRCFYRGEILPAMICTEYVCIEEEGFIVASSMIADLRKSGYRTTDLPTDTFRGK